MLVQVLDANSQPHWVVWQGQDQINDFSAPLGASAVGPAATMQQIAPANEDRAGFLFQNTSPNAMMVLEIPEAGEVTSASAWIVNSGGFFPPIPGYPVPTGIISVQGTSVSEAGDTFAYREWQNALGE